MNNFTTDIGQLVLRLRQIYLFALEQQLSSAGVGDITPTMLRLLYPLLNADDMTSGNAATAAGLDKSTGAIYLTEMAELGLVEKQRDPDDRRIVRVKLTAIGRETAITACAAADVLSEQVTQGITPDEYASIKRSLYKLIQNLSS